MKVSDILTNYTQLLGLGHFTHFINHFKHDYGDTDEDYSNNCNFFVVVYKCEKFADNGSQTSGQTNRWITDKQQTY